MNFFLNKILAVVVLYNEDLVKSNTFISICNAIPEGQVLELLVYDNSPKKTNSDKIQNEKFIIHYYHDHRNSGVSAAYNYGARFAKENNKEWLLILDQDTFFDENLLEEYFRAINEYNDISLFAPVLKIKDGIILSPCKFDFYGRHLKTIKPGVSSFFINSPINSGILVKITAFEEAGGYNERVPLDLSDHQFIERFKYINNHYVVVNSIGTQNFSAIEDNTIKQLNRFEYYCLGVFNFETKSVFKKALMILFLILKTFKKALKDKTLRFFMIFFAQLRAMLFSRNKKV